MNTKVCTCCHIEKELDAFGFEKKGKYGRRSKCRVCRSETEKQGADYRHQHYIDNKDHIKEWRKSYYLDNIEHLRKARTDYYQTHKSEQNEYMKDYLRQRRILDPDYRLSSNISSGIWYSIKDNKAGNNWESIVGYGLDDLKNHLEKMFQAGMTWDNYGEWHIDHIKPKSSFANISNNRVEFNECWALDNLQPLWAKDNLRKGSKYL